jgi:hypothetical protein
MCSAPLFNDHVPARILPNYIGFKRGPFAVMVSHQVVFFHLGGLPKLDWASPGKSRRATSSRRLLYIEQQQSVFEESYKCVFGGNPNRRRPICFQKTKKKLTKKWLRGESKWEGGTSASGKAEEHDEGGWTIDRDIRHTQTAYTPGQYGLFFSAICHPYAPGFLWLFTTNRWGKKRKNVNYFLVFTSPFCLLGNSFKNTTWGEIQKMTYFHGNKKKM